MKNTNFLRRISINTKLIPLALLAIVFMVQPAFAEIDLSNQKIASIDGKFILEFLENTEKIKKDRIIKTPNLDVGIIKLPHKTILLDNNRVNILANSFAVHMDYGVIYAKNNRDGTFKITVLTVENNKFVKDIFVAKIEPIIKVTKQTVEDRSSDILDEYWKTRSESIRQSDKELVIVVQEEDKEIALVIQSPKRLLWKSNFEFDVRVLDPALNPHLDYYSKNGRIENASISGTIKDVNGATLKSFNGTTSQFGHYSNFVYIPENININGAFTLDILATKYWNGETLTSSILKEFFVYTPSKGASKPICSADSELVENGICP